ARPRDGAARPLGQPGPRDEAAEADAHQRHLALAADGEEPEALQEVAVEEGVVADEAGLLAHLLGVAEGERLDGPEAPRLQVGERLEHQALAGARRGGRLAEGARDPGGVP